MRHRAHKSRIAGHRIGSIHFFKMEVGKAADQAGDVSARGLHFDRHRDGIPVVLDHKNHRKPGVGGGVQRLPELALAGGAFAQGNVGDLVAVEFDVFELPVVAGGFLGGIRMSG